MQIRRKWRRKSGLWIEDDQSWLSIELEGDSVRTAEAKAAARRTPGTSERPGADCSQGRRRGPAEGWRGRARASVGNGVEEVANDAADNDRGRMGREGVEDDGGNDDEGTMMEVGRETVMGLLCQRGSAIFAAESESTRI